MIALWTKLRTRHMKINKKVEKIIDRVMDVFIYTVVAGLLFIAVIVLAIAWFHIPTGSMEPTLIPGDNILVEKLSYGARLFNVGKALDGEEVEMKRMPALRGVKRNDVVVFHDPCPYEWRRIEMDMRKYYLKRCVALPGDTFRIVNGRYRVDGCDKILGHRGEQDKYADWVRIMSQNGDDPIGLAFPGDSLMGWTVMDFGPLYLPRKGDRIAMDRESFLCYRDAMRYETKREPAYRNDSVLLGDSLITEYVFKQNYYFMAGDRANNSRDSRYWGILPEDFIVGRVWMIWDSKERNGGIRKWERVGKWVK